MLSWSVQDDDSDNTKYEQGNDEHHKFDHCTHVCLQLMLRQNQSINLQESQASSYIYEYNYCIEITICYKLNLNAAGG